MKFDREARYMVLEYWGKDEHQNRREKWHLQKWKKRKEGRRSDGARTTHGACNNTTCMNMTKHMMIWQDATRKRMTWQRRRVTGRHLAQRSRGIKPCVESIYLGWILYPRKLLRSPILLGYQPIKPMTYPNESGPGILAINQRIRTLISISASADRPTRLRLMCRAYIITH